MLRRVKEQRSLKENLMLASSTAFVSGTINVAGVIAFLAFTSNITGHFASLAKHVVEKNTHQILVFFIWLSMFFLGAFAANYLVRSAQNESKYRAHARPIIIEIIVLFIVAFYGHHFYDETQTEREIIIGATIFSMGLQNGLVSNISGGLIKTSHLTGLFTDLGSDVAEWVHPRSAKTTAVKHKIYIRLTVLLFYFLGGIAGGYFFYRFEFAIFYFIPLILLTILYYDLVPVALRRISRFFTFFANRKQPRSNY